MIYFDVDSKIKPRKMEELVDLPVTVTVNSFTEEAALKFRDAFTKAVNTGQKIVPVVIDSYGGEVYSLLSMVDTIKASPVPVATICTGKGMSCGAVLLTCGTEGKRYIDPMGTVMIHDVSGGAFGKNEEIKMKGEEVNRLNETIYQLMARNCGKDDGYFLKLVDEHKHADWYLSADDCKTHNIANHIRHPSFKVKILTEITFS
jgi:ATP-dependent Clp protease, protease subunit